MKQIFQDLSSGSTELVDCPAPSVRSGHLLIDTSVSLISTGTERMLVEFGRAGLISKARKQPEKVAQVLDKVRTDGLITTLDAVRSKLGQPIPLGYSNVGRVREVGNGVSGFAVGDRVVSNGPHADVVLVPRNLAARIPHDVSDEEASFAVVGSIALQGIRLAQPTLGESFAVIGVGLIGLLAVQLLKANGCRVLAIDNDEGKLDLARQFGAETCNPNAGGDPISAAVAASRGIGMDGVIIAASTKSSAPISQSAQMCRKRGRVVQIGVTGLELRREDFYEKEISFQVSCSYGPGRYDSEYEERGRDYPVGFVRWTEQRNFVAVLDMLASKALDVAPLISHRHTLEKADQAYEVLASDRQALGILLQHEQPVEERHQTRRALIPSAQAVATKRPSIGFIGAGNYATRMLIPAFAKAGARLHMIASAGGSSSVIHGKRAGFAIATSDSGELIADSDIDAVAVATRPNSHARFVIECLRAGKHVFVEKPLALTFDELAQVEAEQANSNRHLMVGFNRRFAPLVQKMKRLTDAVHEPKSFVMVMNAGHIPVDNWNHDPSINGGRIIGEACHHIDLMRFLAGSPIVSIQARRMGENPAVEVVEDKAVIVLGFEDGSFGTVHYLANGGSVFPKERVEIFTANRTLQLDNFISLRGFNWPGFRRRSVWRQDKGQTACAAAFLDAVENGGVAPIPANELFEVARVTIEASEILRSQGGSPRRTRP